MQEQNTQHPEKPTLVLVLVAMVGVLIISLGTVTIAKISSAGLPMKTPLPTHTMTPHTIATPRLTPTVVQLQSIVVPTDTTPRKPTTTTPTAQEPVVLPANHPGFSAGTRCESCHTNLRKSK